MQLNYKQILHLCATEGLFTPYVTEQHYEGLSYGPEPGAYGLRLGEGAYLIKDVGDLDPLNFNKEEAEFIEAKNPWWLPPRTSALCKTLESVKVPKGYIVYTVGKSTHSRVFLIQPIGKAEPGFKGPLTLEFTNPHEYRAIKMYPNMGILSASVIRLDGDDFMKYEGKYRVQTKITFPKAG